MKAGGISGDSRGDHPPPEAVIHFEVGAGGEKKWIGQDGTPEAELVDGFLEPQQRLLERSVQDEGDSASQ